MQFTPEAPIVIVYVSYSLVSLFSPPQRPNQRVLGEFGGMFARGKDGHHWSSTPSTMQGLRLAITLLGLGFVCGKKSQKKKKV